MTDPNRPTEIETDDVRAGETKGAMRYVLGISLALVIIIFAILFFR